MGGYDSVETLRLLDGIVDICMPDMKYGSADIALKYSKIRNYPQVNRAAVKEMYRQVGTAGSPARNTGPPWRWPGRRG